MLVAVLLLCAMLMTGLVSCVSDKGETVVTTDAPEGTGGEQDTVETKLTSGIGDDVTFDGEEVHWFIWKDVTMDEFYVDEMTGDEIQDQIFLRNKDIQKKYGVTYIYHEEKGSSSHMDEYEKRIEIDFSGDAEYEIMAAYSQLPVRLSTKGYLANLKDFKYLDFDKPWWPNQMVSDLTINNNLYFCTGDISTNLLWMMTVLYFNKDLAEDYQLPNLYDLVDNYEWTQEKLLELTKDIFTDTNGNGKKDDDDKYGLGIVAVSYDAFATAAGTTSIVKDVGTDLFMINPDFFGEKMSNMIDMGIKLYESRGTRYYSATNATVRAHFGTGDVVFWADRTFVGAREFQAEGADVTFGVLPVPMYDSLQQKYYTNVGYPFSLYTINSNVMEEEQMDKVSAVLQEMAFRSYRDITPEIFDTALKNRYSDEPDDARMFDLIKENISFEISRFLNQEVGNTASNGYRTTVISGQNTWSSTANKNFKVLNYELGELNKKWSNGLTN
jgi:hypothetical protein